MLRIGETLDRYVVEALLGQGGMAAVYRARHTGLDSLHAIKVLFITAPEVRQRLMAEGKVQANLRHPNIVAVTDILEVQGAPALVMEFIDGPALDAWLDDNRPTLREALFIFRGVLRGVMAAHGRGVIHRDLKPANVLLAPTNEGVVPKVADFGLVKSISSSRGNTQTGLAMGTPEYMAPEQIRDASDVDQRADMFALGCILYELVTGERCFRGPDNVSVFNAIVAGKYTSTKEIAPELPRNVHTAIRWLLEINPEKRLANCAELFDLLYEESDGPHINVDASAEPIVLSHAPAQRTPMSAHQANSDTLPRPSQREVTPGNAYRVTPMEAGYRSDAVTQLQATGAHGGRRSMAPVLIPVVVVLGMAFAVTTAYRQNDAASNALEVASVAASDRAWVPPSPVPVVPAPDSQPTVQPGAQPRIGPTPAVAPQPQRSTAPVPVPPVPVSEPPAPTLQPSAEPEPTQDAGGTVVTLAGDAQGVWLQDSSGRIRLPASVSEGRYSVQADFGEGASDAGTVDVRGPAMTIECQSFLYICVPK
jgi:serine/threonine-protein kinase